MISGCSTVSNERIFFEFCKTIESKLTLLQFIGVRTESSAVQNISKLYMYLIRFHSTEVCSICFPVLFFYFDC